MSDIICSKEQPIGDKSLLKADSTTTAKTKDLPSFLKMPTPEAVEVFQAAFDNHTDSVPFDGRLVPNQWLLNERGITAKVAADFEAQIESLQREKAALQSLADTAGMDAERAITRADKAELDLKCLQESTVDAKAYQALQRENEAATQYASNLVDELQRRFYPEVTGWTKLPDINGILSQIDNMTAGIAAIAPEMRERMGKALEFADSPGRGLGAYERELIGILRDLLGERG